MTSRENIIRKILLAHYNIGHVCIEINNISDKYLKL